MDVSSGDYYRRLRVSPTASRLEIKAAFRRLARQYHPDLHPNEPEAAARFQALREAYEVLIDRVRRHRYDQLSAQRYSQWNAWPDSATRSSGHSTESVADRGNENDSPQTPTDFYIRGIHHAIAHRYPAAIKDYSQAIALDDRFAEAYLRRAEVRYLLKDDSGVLSDCQQAIALNATEGKSYYYQGLARYRLGYVQSAIAAFTHAINCDPEEARYHRWRAVAAQDLNDLDDAAKDFRRSAQLYREQGDLVNYQAVQQALQALGPAGLAWPKRLLVRSWERATQPLLQRFNRRPSRHSNQRSPAREKTSAAKDTTLEQSAGEAVEPPPYKPWNRQPSPPPRNNSETGEKTPVRPPRMPSRKGSRNLSGPAKKATYWAPGVSSRPESSMPFHRRLIGGATTLLRLISNPGGEVVPVYQQLPAGKHTIVGYGLAVLANLYFVLGASQSFVNNTWLVASCLWAVGAFTFVAMVLILSVVRLRLRIRGLWAADIFILGTTLLPLGLLTLLVAIGPRVAAYLEGIGWGELGALLALIGLGMGAMWSFSHSFIALHSGLSRIHQFPARLSAWLTPVMLSFGLSVGLVTWMLFTT